MEAMGKGVEAMGKGVEAIERGMVARVPRTDGMFPLYA